MSLNLFETRTVDPSREEVRKARKEEQKRKLLEQQVRNEGRQDALQKVMDTRRVR